MTEDRKPDAIVEIAAAVEKIAVAVDDTKAVVAAGVVAGTLATAPAPEVLRQQVQAILEQVGAIKWAAEDALEKIEALRDSLGGPDDAP